MFASERGHEACVAALIANGADVVAAAEDGHTALTLASKYDFTKRRRGVCARCSLDLGTRTLSQQFCYLINLVVLTARIGRMLQGCSWTPAPW